MATAQQELQNGQTFQQAGNRPEARRCYERALQQEPANSRAWFLLGMLALADRQPTQAIAHIRRALDLKPDYVDACGSLASILQAQGNLDEAVVYYRRTLDLRPDFPEVYCNLGNALQAKNDLPAAIAAYYDALRLRPNFPEVYNSLGVALKSRGQLDDAIVAYGRALALKPDYLSAHTNLAIALRAKGKAEESIAASERALAINPRHIPALLNLGGVMEDLLRLAEALEVYQRILQIDPGHAGAQSNVGVLLQAQNRPAEAMAAYRRALELKPDNVEALTNLGTAFQARNEIAAALASYQSALALQPGLAQARFNLGVCQLLAGDFRGGWTNYESRWQSEQGKFRRPFTQPFWRGDGSLAGQTILVYPEQGLGDTLQFVRYVPLLAQLGATVVLEVQPPLRALLDSFPGAKFVIARGQPLPDFDLHCPLLSLPLAFSTTLETIPAWIPYLRTPPDKLAQWRNRLNAPSPTPRIGLVWSGGTHHKTDFLRSIPLERFKRIVTEQSARFYCLQKDVKETDAAVLATTPEIIALAPEIADFTDTAAIVEQLDLVITVDTSVAHLAGALGRPTWILLPFAPDWRWLLDRTDSPWYPTVKLFRQPSPDDWDSVLIKVWGELQSWIACK